MTRSIALAVAFAVIASTAANAEETPKACGPDLAIQCVPYHENEVVKLTLSPDVATVIALHPGETMSHAPMTDDENFEIKPFADNNVMIRPLPQEVGHTPNLTLFAEGPDGSQRLYALAIDVEETGGPKILRYTYPGDAAKARAERADAAAKRRQDDVIDGRLKTAMFYGSGTDKLNHAYECRCANGPDIIPNDIADNGQTTAFRYLGTRAAPAFYTVSPDGHEAPVSTTRVGDLYVAPMVAQYWRLRQDNEVIELRNRSYHPDRAGWGTGTVSSDVVRKVVATPFTKAMK